LFVEGAVYPVPPGEVLPVGEGEGESFPAEDPVADGLALFGEEDKAEGDGGGGLEEELPWASIGPITAPIMPSVPVIPAAIIATFDASDSPRHPDGLLGDPP
jgi:hypothetical protein